MKPPNTIHLPFFAGYVLPRGGLVLPTLLRRTRKSVLIAGLILAVVAVEAVVVGAFYWSERGGLRARQAGFTLVEPVSDYWYPYPARVIVRPPVVEADAAGLDEAEEVIGVEVRGKARAYRLKIMQNRDQKDNSWPRGERFLEGCETRNLTARIPYAYPC